MIRRTIEVEDESEYLAAQQAVAMVRELKTLADATPDGKVLAAVEAAAVDRGRKFVRDRLQDVLNAQAELLEQKPGSAPAAGPAGAAARPSGDSSAPPVM